MAKIVFVRDRRTKKWLALLSTDTSLRYGKIVTAYKRRWDIEVFFKMAKSFFNLTKECQGRSYDALVVLCYRYIMIALAKRTNKDPRTRGTLFHSCCEEPRPTTFVEVLVLVLMFLEQAMGTATEMTRELIRSLIDQFLSRSCRQFTGEGGYLHGKITELLVKEQTDRPG